MRLFTVICMRNVESISRALYVKRRGSANPHWGRQKTSNWTRIQIRYTKHNVRRIIPEILLFLNRFRFPFPAGFPWGFPVSRGRTAWSRYPISSSISIYLSFIWFAISYGRLCALRHSLTEPTTMSNSNLIETICVKLLERFPRRSFIMRLQSVSEAIKARWRQIKKERKRLLESK